MENTKTNLCDSCILNFPACGVDVMEDIKVSNDNVIGCNRHTTIIKVQFKKGDEYGGRDYSYYSRIPVAVGDIVEVPGIHGTVKAKVTMINAPEAEIAAFKDKVKSIIVKVPESKEGAIVED